jgi:predicted PurR-regulated permease PerM
VRDEPVDDRSQGALRYRKSFLLVLITGISLLFVLVIRPFLLAVLLAAVFAGIAYPLYRWLLVRLWRRRTLAGMVTIVLLLLGVALPLAGFFTLVAAEAAQVSEKAAAWFEEQHGRLDELRDLAERIPLAGRMLPESEDLAEQFGDVAARTGGVLVGKLAAATKGTLRFFLQLFVLLYAMFYFLVDGPEILRRLLYYLPLDPAEEEALLERFVSVTRAALKGSLLIGAIQGAAAGLAFWATGIPGPAFWGTVTAVLSVIPAVGAGLVWVPAVVYLFLLGEVAAGVGLLAWCVLVVSTIDNFLRPWLVGRDARMSDLLILLSTLGGLFLFGPVGFIVGPIVAALFVAIWHIYGETFSDWLPTRLEESTANAGSREPKDPGSAEMV